MRTRGRMLGVLMAVFLLSACSLFTETDKVERLRPEKATVRVGVGNAIETAPVRMAVEKGLFERAGLRVELVEQPDEKAAVKLLTEGQLDVVFASDVTLFSAAAEGTALRLQGEAYVAGAGSMALVTLPDSDYTDPTDLSSPTVAVDTHRSLSTLTTRSVLRTAGLDPASITFRPTPVEDMIDAMRTGEVDAAWMVEPYITLAQQEHGVRVLADCSRGATQDFPMSAYAVTAEFAEDNPRTTALFRRLLDRAQQLGADETLVREALPRLADLDEVTASLVSLGSYPQMVNAVRLQRVADLMQGSGLLDDRLDVRSLVPEPKLS